MISNTTKIRVRYAETDQMGYVYYGNYAQYFEVGRVELLRSLGISYRQLEESGVILPVLDFNIKYHKPARYDEELTIITSMPSLPSVRISFDYQTLNAQGDLLNEGHTTLVFVNKETNKPRPCPASIIENIRAKQNPI
jgi:acyl-CoA thioester hydrolase